MRGLAAFFLASVISLLLLEVVWRWRSAGFGPTTNPHYVVHDARLGWRYRPDVRVRHRSADFDVEVAIGPIGFREQPSMPGRAPEILVLGDSLAFGWGVSGDTTFCRVLEDELGVAVWNLGVSGYGTDQEYLLLRERPFLAGLAELNAELEFAPRCVLVVHCANDVEEVSRDLMYGKSKPQVRIESSGLPRVGNVPVPYSWLEKSSTLYRSLRRHAIERARAPLDEAAVRDAWARLAGLYQAMAQEARVLGADFAVVHEGGGEIRSLIEQNGLEGIDLGADLVRAQQEQGPVTFHSDPHWNEHGHAIVAQSLVVWWRSRTSD
jgi:hypothetical protein